MRLSLFPSALTTLRTSSGCCSTTHLAFVAARSYQHNLDNFQVDGIARLKDKTPDSCKDKSCCKLRRVDQRKLQLHIFSEDRSSQVKRIGKIAHLATICEAHLKSQVKSWDLKNWKRRTVRQKLDFAGFTHFTSGDGCTQMEKARSVADFQPQASDTQTSGRLNDVTMVWCRKLGLVPRSSTTDMPRKYMGTALQSDLQSESKLQ